MNNYFIEDNVLTESNCNFLIDFFKQSCEWTKTWSNEDIPKEIHTLQVLNVSNIINLNMFDLLENKYKKIFNYNKLDNLEIVKWPEGSYAKEHIDGEDRMGFFVYLNDNFQGGENELVDIHKVTPKKGRMSLFDNGKLLHKVNKVTRGDRYMLSGFYQ